MNHRKHIQGIPFDDMSLPQLTQACFAIQQKNGSCAVFTPNALMLAQAAKAPSLRALLSTADVSAVDGDGVLLAAKLTGQSLSCGKTAGIELGKHLLKEAAQRGETVFLYGGKPGVAEKAAERLQKELPTLRIIGTCHGYGSEKEAAARIAASGAVLTLVCLGFPKQERWIATYRSQCGGVLAGLGGSLDIYAGQKSRAPRSFRKHHLEWLWRMAQEPKRARGIGKLLLYFGSLLLLATQSKVRTGKGALSGDARRPFRLQTHCPQNRKARTTSQSPLG